MNIQKLPLSQIRLDGGTQPRAAIDMAVVDDYADAMHNGVKFPPVTVFYDGAEYWLADGFHRRKALYTSDSEDIECEVRQGTREDAQWFSFSANKTHGLRRTNEDKQQAVKAALMHPKGVALSDHQIGKHVGAIDTTNIGRKNHDPLPSDDKDAAAPAPTSNRHQVLAAANRRRLIIALAQTEASARLLSGQSICLPA